VTRWDIRRARGNVSELQESSAALIAHLADAAAARPRFAIVQNGVNPALVLGSAQPESTVDRDACAAAGVEVVRRRSGGGAVLVDPGSVVWVDLVVAATDPLWSADVGRSMWWVGEAWAKALEGAGFGDLSVWKGPMVRNAWSSLVCFAGLGPGEVVNGGRRKLVGIAQRRTRHGALFQCACVLRWEPEALLQLLALPEDQRRSASHEVAGAATGVGVERAEAVVEGFFRALPS
jgi:lipoate---protein ligase